MRKGMFAFVLGLCVWGAALAADVPEGELVVTLADGTVVGVGELADGGLELELLTGTSGFVTFTVTGEDGVVASFEVAVGEDGSLMVVESFEDLADSVVAAGGEVEVSFEENVDFEAVATVSVEGAEHETGLDRADAKASEHAAAGLARARAARDGDVAGEVEVEDAEDAEDASEQAAEEAQEAAEGDEEAEEDSEEDDDSAGDGKDADSRAGNRGGKPQND